MRGVPLTRNVLFLLARVLGDLDASLNQENSRILRQKHEVICSILCFGRLTLGIRL